MHNDNLLYELFSLVQFDITYRHEIYTLAQLCNFCQQLTTTEDNSAKFRSIDLRNKLKEKFKQKQKFFKPLNFSLTSASEFVMSSADSVLPNCLSRILLGDGIAKRLPIKNCAKSVREEIQDYPASNTTSVRKEKYTWQSKQLIQSYCIDCQS